MNERTTLKVNGKNHLEIGGVDSVELVKKYGTPLYVMDKEYIEKMCKTYIDAIKEYGEGKVLFASKAFCCKEIYRIIDGFGLGADVVSGGEIYTALSAGFDAEKLYFHGNNKTFSELSFAISSKVGTIVADSLEEIDIINDYAKRNGIKQNILIRVNAGVEAHTHHYIQTAKSDSKFGFSIADGSAINAIKRALNKPYINLKGLHSHIGSQIFEAKSFVIAGEKLIEFYKKVLDEEKVEFSELNLGGGFGIYYSGDDKMMKEEDYKYFVKVLFDAVYKSCDKYGVKKPVLVIEPGRSIVGEAGITLYTVGQIKKIKGIKTYAAVDGGMFENPRFALYQARYTVVKADEVKSDVFDTYTVAGKCCESGDVLAEDVKLPPLKSGDVLAILSTGAYNYSMASNYNRNLIPPTVYVKDGKSGYMIKPQTYEDLLRNDI